MCIRRNKPSKKHTYRSKNYSKSQKRNKSYNSSEYTAFSYTYNEWSKNKYSQKTASVLDSAIKATEESTRTGAINEQVQTIKSIEKAKIQQQEIQKDVEEQ